MNILHLLTQTELTGSEVYAQKLVEVQVKNGHRVWTVSDEFHIPFEGQHLTRPVSARSRIRRLRLIFELIQKVITLQIDVIHAHSRGALRIGYWLSKLTRTPLYTTLHGRQHFSLSKKLFDTYGDLVMVVCENLRRQLIRELKFNPYKLWIAPNPILPPPSQKTGHTKGVRNLALMGRASGPKGEKLREIFFKYIPELLKTNPELKVTFICGPFSLFPHEDQELLLDLLTFYKGRLFYEETRKKLLDHLAKFDGVVAGGRIAAEAILAGVPTLVMGEWGWIGPVNEETWETAIQSNFGDMGDQELEMPLNGLQIERDLKNFIVEAEVSPEICKRVTQHFDPTLVAQRVQTYYQFKDLPNSWIPTLMYHKIPDQDLQSQHKIFVNKNQFEKQLQWLKKRGFESVTFEDLAKKTRSQLPIKPIILTFDDGYKDALTNAGPLLQKYGFRGVLYLLSDTKILSNTWDTNSDSQEPSAELLTPTERQEVAKYFEIGSHGVSHRDFHQLSNTEILHELTASKANLEKEFPGHTIWSFCYPYGRKPEGVEDLAYQAGYRFAVGTDRGGMTLRQNPYHIFRANVFPKDDHWALWKKTHSLYRQYFRLKRGV